MPLGADLLLYTDIGKLKPIDIEIKLKYPAVA